MPKKNQPFNMEILRYWPLFIALLGLVGGYYTLQNKVANASEKIEKLEVDQLEDTKDLQEMRIQQTQIQSKVDQGYELLKDLKEAIKELKNAT